MAPLTPLTELDAVNIMLSTIGESPVSSLSSETSTVDVALATQILHEITVAVQSIGWQFNTETNWVMDPTLPDGEIFLPANCVQIDTVGVSSGVDVAQRGNRLYDRTAHTFSFTKSVTVEMILLLDFTDLPQAARHYIAIRAARVFQQRVVGADSLAQFTARDEAMARAALKKFDSNNADYNILNGSWSVQRILSR